MPPQTPLDPRIQTTHLLYGFCGKRVYLEVVSAHSLFSGMYMLLAMQMHFPQLIYIQSNTLSVSHLQLYVI